MSPFFYITLSLSLIAFVGVVISLRLRTRQAERMALELRALNTKLKQAQRTKVEMIEEFGHDLRTPLMAIQTILESLEMHDEQMDKDTKRKNLGLALGELNYLIQLLDDMYVMGKMTSPGYRVCSEKIDCLALLESEIHQVTEGGVGDKQIRLEVEEGPEPLILGDEKLMRRLLRNILLNAVRFAKGMVRVQLSARSERSHVLFCIRDDGKGFTAEALERFGQRVHARDLKSLSENKASTGLGSVIASAIVDSHQGTIKVQNWRNKKGEIGGAEILIEIPKRAA